jgi:hypothetical protein
MTGAVIHDIQIAAAHDGEAELVVTLTYENGGRSLVTLDEYAARSLLEAGGNAGPDSLIGASWELVRDALAASSARYSDNRTKVEEI